MLSVFQLASPDWYWHYVGRITFNSSGSHYALAYRDNAVVIHDMDGLDIFPANLAGNIEGNTQAIPSLVFSPSDRWLARIRGETVTVWRVSGLGDRLQYESDLPGAKFLAFDYLEELLFVASNEAITVIDLAEMSIVATLSTPDLTAFTVSSDNRLLIWGDSAGAVHMWGTP